MMIKLKHKAYEPGSVLYTAQMCLGIHFKYSLFILMGVKRIPILWCLESQLTNEERLKTQKRIFQNIFYQQTRCYGIKGKCNRNDEFLKMLSKFYVPGFVSREHSDEPHLYFSLYIEHSSVQKKKRNAYLQGLAFL